MHDLAGPREGDLAAADSEFGCDIPANLKLPHPSRRRRAPSHHWLSLTAGMREDLPVFEELVSLGVAF